MKNHPALQELYELFVHDQKSQKQFKEWCDKWVLQSYVRLHISQEALEHIKDIEDYKKYEERRAFMQLGEAIGPRSVSIYTDKDHYGNRTTYTLFTFNRFLPEENN